MRELNNPIKLRNMQSYHDDNALQCCNSQFFGIFSRKKYDSTFNRDSTFISFSNYFEIVLYVK